MASGCVPQFPQPAWDQCPHHLQGMHEQENSPEEVHAATEELRVEFMEGKRAAWQLARGPSQPQKQPPQQYTKMEAVPGLKNTNT